eukprot:1630383-Karenia_brevis.AAC.1
MVRYRVAQDFEKPALGIFFVAKKSGGIRIIFDTRILNCSFIDPPSTALPSAAAFANIETDPQREFFFASADIRNCFYSLAVPHEMSDMSTLQGCQA